MTEKKWHAVSVPPVEAVETLSGPAVQKIESSTQMTFPTMSSEVIFLTTETHFDAAHRLLNYDGKCSQLHGHRWVVKAEFGPFTEDDLDASGIALDFKDIKKDLNAIVDVYDHEYLNDFFALPSAEKIALEIFGIMKRSYDDLYAIDLFESPESKCRVMRNGS